MTVCVFKPRTKARHRALSLNLASGNGSRIQNMSFGFSRVHSSELTCIFPPQPFGVQALTIDAVTLTL